MKDKEVWMRFAVALTPVEGLNLSDVGKAADRMLEEYRKRFPKKDDDDGDDDLSGFGEIDMGA